jgi:hypothetical protein
MKKYKKKKIPLYTTICQGKKKGATKTTIQDDTYVEALRNFSIEHKL